MKTFLSIISLSMLVVMLTFCLSCFGTYFYPPKLQYEISSASEEYGVSPALIASIINVESRYKKDALSQKGAVGLMQIMPETAKWICVKNGEDFENIDLQDEKTNINLGSQYLASLLTSFDSLDNAICAYNAGPSKVKAWLADKEFSDDGKVLKKIPYQETRDYLEKVKKNLRVYEKRF